MPIAPNNDKIVINQMLQACKNIMAATSGISCPEDFSKDEFIIENIYINLTLIVEGYVNITPEKRDSMAIINWEEVKKYTDILSQDANSIDLGLLLFTCKNKIPLLKQKLETISS